MKSHEKWFLKAENDLSGAKVLLQANLFDIAISHTQQCGEKALKGFLAFCKHPIEKTHNLTTLIAICKQYDPSFSTIGSIAEWLTPFATEFRYPDLEIYPSKDLLLKAIQDAEEILRFSKNRIEQRSMAFFN